jgi:hypothetical protein
MKFVLAERHRFCWRTNTAIPATKPNSIKLTTQQGMCLGMATCGKTFKETYRHIAQLQSVMMARG